MIARVVSIAASCCGLAACGSDTVRHILDARDDSGIHRDAAIDSAASHTLIGSTVTATLYNPDLATILGGPASATVGQATPTFPNGTILGNSQFEIDIVSDRITYNPLQNVTYGAATFNGFVFQFTNAPTILGVTLDSTSNFTPTNITFTSNSVSINLSGNTVTTTSTAILDLQL